MIHHWMHLYAAGAWKEPLNEHLDALQGSGLGSTLFMQNSMIRYGVVGTYEQSHEAFQRLWAERSDEGKTRIIRSATGFEQVTIAALQEDVQRYDDDDLVLYWHTKGAANPSEWNTAWRRTMEHFTVTHWQEMTAALADHDIACIWWISEEWHPNPHPQGNFWWARADYLKTLPLISTDDRWKAELWVGQANPRVYDAYPGSAGGSPLIGSPDFNCKLCDSGTGVGDTSLN